MLLHNIVSAEMELLLSEDVLVIQANKGKKKLMSQPPRSGNKILYI
jgi:hypothetical protein